MKLSFSEENYLKAIYHLSNNGEQQVLTNEIASSMKTKPASVSDMIKKLALKKLLDYKKYQGVKITEEGKLTALRIIRKHRLWETFLVKKLKFDWHQVHEVAEQLEHIRSQLLIERLDEFLGFPAVDPHGDPIPKPDGSMQKKPSVIIEKMKERQSGTIVAVKDSDPEFLKYMDKIGAYLGAQVRVVEKIPYDGSMYILIDNIHKVAISKQVAQNILVSE